MMNSPYILVCAGEVSLEQCMRQIEENHEGFVALALPDSTVFGVLTDGDIRRALLNGAKIGDRARAHSNRNFKFVTEDATREHLLKLLDANVRFVPMLDLSRRLVRIITLNDLEYLKDEGPVTTRAKAPARISFGGGGTDLTPFFLEHGGAVLNATINLFSYATLKSLPNTQAVVISSNDFGTKVEAENADLLKYDGNLDLIKAAIKLLKPEFGFELEIRSDFPPSSGLGGSSVVLAAVIGSFNELRRNRLSEYDVAELAFQAERLELSCAGGWQDQYAAVFGGFNFMEFRQDRNEINALRVSNETQCELEERLVLCFSGESHPVGKIHDIQRQRMVAEIAVTEFAKKSRDLAYEMKSQLLRGNLDVLGNLLHRAWGLKKTLSTGVTSQKIDEIYDFAIENGALGGKILGAGGGGYFLFFAQHNGRYGLKSALKQRGLEVRDFLFESRGLRSWSVRK